VVGSPVRLRKVVREQARLEQAVIKDLRVFVDLLEVLTSFSLIAVPRQVLEAGAATMLKGTMARLREPTKPIRWVRIALHQLGLRHRSSSSVPMQPPTDRGRAR
jgi:hypothetical protein